VTAARHRRFPGFKTQLPGLSIVATEETLNNLALTVGRGDHPLAADQAGEARCARRQASRPLLATAKAFNGALHECMRQTSASVETSQPLRLLNDERRRADHVSFG